MLCENCKKKDATSIFVSPSSKKLMYLCGACYRRLNNEVELETLAINATKTVDLEKKCQNCGESFQEFQSSGLFGCENCYTTFEEYLKNNFLCLFKEKKYLGKKPNLFYVQKQITELEQMVEICLKNGDLQKATKYGVEIQNLKEQNYGKL